MTRAAAIGLCALLSCTPGAREAAALVRAYNDAVILAYRTAGYDALKSVATPEEWGRVVVLVDLKTSNGLVLESELQALEVTRVENVNPDLMKVSTKERWKYWDRAVKPGTPSGTVFVADTTLVYEFVRMEGAWKMSNAITLTNDYLVPAGFTLEPRRAHEARDAGVPTPG